MGRSYKIRLIIRKSSNHNEHFGEWMPIKRYGRLTGFGKPTSENLSTWRDQFNMSLLPGGANEHLGIKYWLQCKLEIYNQFTNEIVCIHNPPIFEVIQ